MNFEERIEVQINDHTERIRALEIKDATQNERINSLCAKMEELTNTLEKWMGFAQNLFWKILGAAGGIILILAGFFIWYVQSLPR